MLSQKITSLIAESQLRFCPGEEEQHIRQLQCSTGVILNLYSPAGAHKLHVFSLVRIKVINTSEVKDKENKRKDKMKVLKHYTVRIN